MAKECGSDYFMHEIEQAKNLPQNSKRSSVLRGGEKKPEKDVFLI